MGEVRGEGWGKVVLPLFGWVPLPSRVGVVMLSPNMFQGTVLMFIMLMLDILLFQGLVQSLLLHGGVVLSLGYELNHL